MINFHLKGERIRCKIKKNKPPTRVKKRGAIFIKIGKKGSTKGPKI